MSGVLQRWVRIRPKTLRRRAAEGMRGGSVMAEPHRVRRGAGAHEITATRMTRHAVR